METKQNKKPVTKVTATPEAKKDTWEYKDRNYYLLGNKNPLTYTIISRHTRRYPLVWFDKDLGYEREMRYATNQKSIFVDEQEGTSTLSHIVFSEGHLRVPKEKRNLQELLLNHPHRDLIFGEHDAVVEAEDQYDYLEMEIAALNTAYDMDIDQAEAILRVEQGSGVTNMSSKELKRDLLLFAKHKPKLFLNLSEDENVELRNFGIKAVEANILELNVKERVFKWASNGKKIMTIPFEEHPYSALAGWFKTDEGLEIYKSIDKKLK